MPRIGLVSDTHGFLDPQVPGLFTGVDHIVHGGDIGWPQIILELEAVAPVTAVMGNTDHGLPYRETEVCTVGNRKLLVQHIVRPHRLEAGLARRLRQERPDVVVFGHTHEPFCERVQGVLFVNPGSAGRSRLGKPRTVALLEWGDGETDVRVDFMELGR